MEKKKFWPALFGLEIDCVQHATCRGWVGWIHKYSEDLFFYFNSNFCEYIFDFTVYNHSYLIRCRSSEREREREKSWCIERQIYAWFVILSILMEYQPLWVIYRYNTPILEVAYIHTDRKTERKKETRSNFGRMRGRDGGKRMN